VQLRNSAQRYGAIPKLLHWLTVALVVVAWALGTFGDDLPRGVGHSAGPLLHISTGLAIIALCVIRITWRLADPPPSPEKKLLRDGVELTGKVTHVALYGLLAATPIVGVLLQFAHGDALPVFGFSESLHPGSGIRVSQDRSKGCTRCSRTC